MAFSGTSDFMGLQHRRVRYDQQNYLQTMDVWLPQHNAKEPADFKSGARLWLVYIHGGCWTKPDINSTSFIPALERIRTDPNVRHFIGYASINYRLSPEKYSFIREQEWVARNAKHPDHIHDVLRALKYLQTEYKFKDRYMLVGSDSGATLAFQVAMKTWDVGLEVELPRAILGVAGFYDLDHVTEEEYSCSFRELAFGKSVDLRQESPISGAYKSTWKNGLIAAGAVSDDDQMKDGKVEKWMTPILKASTIVEGHEPGDSTTNTSAISSDGTKHQLNAQVTRLETFDMTVKGSPDSIWRNGSELCRAIIGTLKVLMPKLDDKDVLVAQ